MSSSNTTSQSVHGLVGHVSRLAHSSLPLGEFYAQFLDTLPIPPGTLGTVAWVCHDDSFNKIATGSRTLNESVQLPVSAGEHAAQLQDTRVAMQPQRFDPPPPAGYEVYVENALPIIVVLPVVVEESVPVVVEAYLPPDVPEQSIALFVKRAQLLCELASNFHLDTEGSSSDSSNTMGLTPTVHESLRIVDTCYALANEGRRVTGSDRVTVLTRKGAKYRVQAVSGQESVNRRANLVTSLQRLVNRAIKTGEEFWYPADAEKLPPEIENELEAYLEISMSRVVGIIPLQVKAVEVESDDETESAYRLRKASRELPSGALVVEKFTELAGGEDVFRRRTGVLSSEASVALRNAVRHESVFLLPLWAWIGGLGRYFQGNTLFKTLAVLIGLAAATLALIYVPAELKISSDGRLMPLTRRKIFARIEGTIDALNAEHGKSVKQGDLLATIRNHDVDMQMQQTLGEIRKTQTQIEATQSRLLSGKSQETDQNDMFAAAAEKENLKVLKQNLERQVAILKRKQLELQVTCPIDGEIITWELADRLRSRPVQRGQMMMEVAKLEGEWCLELNLPDRRIADVLSAEASSDQPLKVSFILASDTSETLEGEVLEIAKATRIDAEQGQNILVRVSVDEDAISTLQPGTEVQAKIFCGKSKLGYVWLRDVWHFFKTRVIFPFT